MGNLNDVDMSDAGELSEGFSVFPPGEYTLYLESSERKLTNDGEGEYLNCTFVVAEGEFKDRKIPFQMFNLWNKSQKTVEIAKQHWRALCEVTVGQSSAPGQDSASLHFKPFIGTVEVEPAVMTDTEPKTVKYPAKNKLVFKKGKIRSVQGHVGAGQAPVIQPQPVVANSVAQAPAAAQQAAAAPSTGSRPAWAR